MRQIKILIVFALLSACAPYAKGPVFTREDAQRTFQPFIEYMGIKPGMAIADVGAGSGALTVLMATQIDSCTVYIQDIDRELLEQKNVNKMIAYYSDIFDFELGKRNQFHLIHGTSAKSNLPDDSVDIVYSNATVHTFESPDLMLQDFKLKLKRNGRIFIRDSFRGDHDEGYFCSDKKCGRKLYSIDEFLTMMEENGYELIKQSPDMSGYPVYGFIAVKD